ncbi:hypothetical protein ASF27_01745 [Methylobacterium sp. Leaf102]|uniref:DUF2793 domain-containing protein n=1 Tax=Methylobacterium sp. Leaf102 TaxID=1736253 RepID=UPI0006F70010|nr:DUF2793 domain-containing protein [Methylobacterium sp. Leaf102]KQP34310.1 hypothetical protein ASF27_01745 [Methylobacterium sp. Leaf102]
MSDQTANLGLPYLAAAQAQKHVTVNEGLTALDTIVQLACLDKDRTAPPAEPIEGDRYLIAGAAPSGAWAGWAGRIVRFQDGAWRSFIPKPGWLAFMVDEGELYAYAAGAWTSYRSLSGVIVVPASADPPTNGAKLGQFAVNSSALAIKWFNGDAWARINNFAKFIAYTNFDNYVGANAWTKVRFNNTDSNDQNAFVSGTNRFVAPEAGLYRMTSGLAYKRNGSNAPTAFEVQFYQNGVAAGRGRAAATGTLVDGVTTLNLTATLKLAAGDTVEVFARFTGADGYVATADSSFSGAQLA